MELPVALLSVEDQVDFPFFRVIDYERQLFSWPAVGGV
jgi:hypothetical protein